MKFVAKSLNIDMSHEKVELMDDEPILKEEWEVYFIYMEYLIDFMKRMQALSEVYPVITRNSAFIYKLIFRKAIGDPNEFWFDAHPNLIRTFTGDNMILQTLWDRLGVPPVSPYADFFDPHNDGASMWRKYEINELNLRSEFLNMEKIKIAHAIVLKNINVLKLLQ